MRTGLDSAYPPSPAQIAAAKAAGYTAWLGYFAGPAILNGWSDQNFLDVYAGGLDTGAYCSGWADAAQMKARADALRPRIPGFVGMLDDESGIRSVAGYANHLSENRHVARAMMHGGEARKVMQWMVGTNAYQVSAWVQPWLDASGFGQYGNQPVFASVHASRYVFAAYPGADPQASWPSYYPRPADGHPCGWQFQGTTSLFGRSVDFTHFDDNFWISAPTPYLTEDDMLYVGPFKAQAATFKTFAPSVVYSDPSASGLQVGSLASGATVVVTGYLFSTSGVQSSDRGAGAGAGIDYVWWQTSGGTWVSDADLITTGVAGLPEGTALSTLPGGMKLYLAKESEIAGLSGGGVTMAQVTSAIQAAVAALPAGGLTKDQVDAEILTAFGNLPKPSGAPHHHGVLGIINTGPVIPD